MEFWLVVVLVLILSLAAFGINTYLEQQRTSTIQSLASAWGFDYRDHPQAYIPDPVWQLKLFNKGRRRQLKNLIQGQRGNVAISIADYSFVTGSGKHRRTHAQTIAIIQSPHLTLPSFLLTPETMFHKIGGLFGYDDIDFDSRPTFSARYLLKGTDESSIRQCFQDGVLTFYERQEQVCSEGIGSILLYYKARHKLEPNNWKNLMTTVLDAHEQFVQR
ncbi:MAG: hypothetical protein AAFU53_09905 [Cyanobacteria bacterium J06632_3]